MAIKIMNEHEYPRFKIKPKEVYENTGHKKIIKTELLRVSHDKKFKKRIKENDTFLIDNPIPLQNNNRRNMGGIYSPLFGQDIMDPDSRTYSCECNTLYGAVNENKICSVCGTKVQNISPNLRIMGYIDIHPYRILTFHGYNILNNKKIVPDLKEVLVRRPKIDRDGHVSFEGDNILDLYDRYDEEIKPLTNIDKDIVFTSKIPVYSSILRPLIRKGSKMSILDVNKQYQSITTLARDLQHISHIKAYGQIIRSLNTIQSEFLGICTHITTQIAGKGGSFRKYGVSGRIDYSSRMVITLGVDLEAHEIDIPYQTAMVIYEEQIINTLMTLNDITLAKASIKYQAALNYRDNTMVQIINTLINKGLWAMINRNPTISKHGILYVKVRKIHDDFSNHCMMISPEILKLLAADFDGDQLSYYAVKEAKFHELFKRTFCPTYAYINRATGYFNKEMSLPKDYLAVTNKIWNLFKTLDDFVLDANEDTYRKYYSNFSKPYVDDTNNNMNIDEMMEFFSQYHDNLIGERFDRKGRV